MQRYVFNYAQLGAAAVNMTVLEVPIRSRKIYADASFPLGLFAFPQSLHAQPIPITPGGVCVAPQGTVERWYVKVGLPKQGPLLLPATGDGYQPSPLGVGMAGRIVNLTTLWSTIVTGLQDEPCSAPYPGGMAVEVNVSDLSTAPLANQVVVPVATFAPYGCNGLSIKANVESDDYDGDMDTLAEMPYWRIRAYRQLTAGTEISGNPRYAVDLGVYSSDANMDLWASWSFPGRLEPNDAIIVSVENPGRSFYAGYCQLQMYPRIDNPQEPLAAIIQNDDFSAADPADYLGYAICRHYGLRTPNCWFKANGQLTAGNAVTSAAQIESGADTSTWLMGGLQGEVLRDASLDGAFLFSVTAGVGTISDWKVYLQG